MGKLPYGVPSRHVNQSKGPDTNLMKFYCTQNSTTYGQKFSNFQPRPGRHTGTGYLSNFRPGVYYSGHLDDLDNPTMGRLVRDNYSSVTKKSFRPYELATGAEPLPSGTHQVGSGFVRQKPLTFPTKGQARDTFIDTRIASAPANLMPRYKPHLHKIQGKDPVSAENGGYGPNYMSTETQEKFKGHQPDRSDVSRSVGGKEGSGFTHSYNPEPLTFHSDNAYLADVPGWLTDRPTGVSMMKSHYRPTEFTKGDETLPYLANRSVRDTGFTSGTKALPAFVNRVMGDAYDKASDVPEEVLNRIRKQDPVEYMNMTNPNNYSSVTQNVYKGLQNPPQSEAGRLGNTAVGAKELSGFSENNDRYVHTADNPARFVTHYMTKFVDRTPTGLDREGHTWGSIQQQKPDGFTKSTGVHSYGPEINTASLRSMDPYVGRSIKSRDAFFDDHTHDAKFRSSASMIPAI